MQKKIDNNENFLLNVISSPHDGTKSLHNKLLPKHIDINNAQKCKQSTFETAMEDAIAYKKGI